MLLLMYEKVTQIFLKSVPLVEPDLFNALYFLYLVSQAQGLFAPL